VSKFLENRKKNGRRLANKQPVKNLQMWQKLDILIQGKNIEWNWTK
jgi:ribonuclease HI